MIFFPPCFCNCSFFLYNTSYFYLHRLIKPFKSNSPRSKNPLIDLLSAHVKYLIKTCRFSWITAAQHETGRWGHLLLRMCVFESVCEQQEMRWSEAADLSLTPCVVFVSGRWRAASRCWKSSRPTAWRGFWTHWGVYQCVCVCVFH